MLIGRFSAQRHHKIGNTSKQNECILREAAFKSGYRWPEPGPSEIKLN